jgi:hypothetical protein
MHNVWRFRGSGKTRYRECESRTVNGESSMTMEPDIGPGGVVPMSSTPAEEGQAHASIFLLFWQMISSSAHCMGREKTVVDEEIRAVFSVFLNL